MRTTILLALALLLPFGGIADASEGEKQEKVRVYTNEDLPPPPPESTEPVTVSADPAAPPLSYGSYRDRNGHDEAWWRARVAELDAELYEATRELELLHELLPRCTPILGFYPFCDRRDAWQVWLEYEKAVVRVEELEAMRLQLREEARIAGALPGWFR